LREEQSLPESADPEDFSEAFYGLEESRNNQTWMLIYRKDYSQRRFSLGNLRLQHNSEDRLGITSFDVVFCISNRNYVFYGERWHSKKRKATQRGYSGKRSGNFWICGRGPIEQPPVRNRSTE
jgi:hypothetical protein